MKPVKKECAFLLASMAMNCAVSAISFAQTVANDPAPDCKPNWSISRPGQLDVFVKNYGQYDHLSTNEILVKANIKYVYNTIGNVYFTTGGWVWKLDKARNPSLRLDKRERSEGNSEQSLANRGNGKNNEAKEEEEEEENQKIESIYITMNWEGANANSLLIAEDEAGGYYTFALKEYKDLRAKGYRKLIYKDLYPGIDVEYIIPKNAGSIEYSFIVKPGANVNKIKMKYGGDFEKLKLAENGNIVFKTDAGDMVDHAPQSFYNENKNSVKSHFSVIDSNMIGFSLPDDYDHTKILTIDPVTSWPVTPDLSGGYGVFDVGYDKYGNVYLDFFASSQDQISKYDPSGNFLWTANMTGLATPNDYSRFCVIPSGSIFISSGYYASSVAGGILNKVNSAGATVNSVTWPATLDNEGWMVEYNACQNILLIGGGGLNNAVCLRYGVDTSFIGAFTGSNFNNYTTTAQGNDMSTMRIDANGDMYSFFSSKPATNNTLNMLYRSASPYTSTVWGNLRTAGLFGGDGESQDVGQYSNPPNYYVLSNRLNMMEINGNYLFFFDGQNLEARNKATGNVLSSIVVSAAYTAGRGYSNEGIAVDECNNIYVGGQSLVHAFNFNGTGFTTLPTIAVPDDVYDIALDKSRNLLYVVGKNFATSVTATPSAACVNNLSVTPATLSVCGAANGTATLTVSGGLAPYSYSWSNGATASTLTASSGTYTVYVTDASCSNPAAGIATVTITADPALSATLNPTPANCTGGTGGSIATNVTGGSGTGTYNYLWNTAATGPTLSGIGAGTYTVTITDAASCTTSSSVTVTSSSGPDISSIAPVNLLCNGASNGSATVSASSPAGGLSYSWGNGVSSSSSSPNNLLTSLSSGTYTVTVTDGSGCSVTSSVTITEPTAIVPLGTQHTPADCGQSDGSAIASASGGSGSPYTYVWSNAVNGSTNDNIAAGIYTVTVTDQNKCTVTTTDTVSMTGAFSITINNITNTCKGKKEGTITISSPGNNNTYAWSNSASTQDVSDLAFGTYVVTVTNSAGCTATASASVGNLPGPVPNAITKETITSGQKIQLNATPGAASYLWTPDTTLNNASICNPIASPVVTTNYYVTITDANTCSIVDSILVVVDEPYNCDSSKIFVPTAFTPNGDGKNDRLAFHGPECVSQMKLTIFDRWGEMVFETTNPASTWDGSFRGQPEHSSVYIYYLSAALSNGQQIYRKGNLTLLR